MRQLTGQGSSRGSGCQTRQSGPVPQTEQQQDEAIEDLADTEMADLDARPDDAQDDLLSDSSDEDYMPLPRMLRRAHDSEAGGSGSAPAHAQIDPTLIAILDRMQAEQQRQAEEQRCQAAAQAVA